MADESSSLAVLGSKDAHETELNSHSPCDEMTPQAMAGMGVAGVDAHDTGKPDCKTPDPTCAAQCALAHCLAQVAMLPTTVMLLKPGSEVLNGAYQSTAYHWSAEVGLRPPIS
jgi:hypothetical protein